MNNFLGDDFIKISKCYVQVTRMYSLKIGVVQCRFNMIIRISIPGNNWWYPKISVLKANQIPVHIIPCGKLQNKYDLFGSKSVVFTSFIGK